MTSKQKKLLKKIAKDAVRLDWEQAFGGKSYGNRHLFRVNKIAQFLQTKEGGNGFVVLAGAWVHDVSLAFGSDADIHRVEKHTREFLKNYNDLTKKELEKIVDCAVGHEVGSKNLSLEARIVHDADVIDKSRMLGIVRHAWKMTNLLEKRILDQKKDVETLEKHLKEREAKVFTKTARRLVAKINKERDLFFRDRALAEKVVKVISKKAIKGVISDKIADFLIKRFDEPSMKLLERQLNCTFLQRK